MSWALQDAKARFSEVVKRAQTEGPQEVTVRGEPAVVVISQEEFSALQRGQKATPKKSIVDHLLDGPAWPDDFVEMVNARSKEPGRDIEF
ncbi:type II toxin-antitoxin system Phd/YefM family antitoxin [Bosea caraganae]|uniref:Antitoxin n=1 Tax=Bosea caraganae TaxID=2763117 RepID=A0A370L4F8_9HYPH|nr:type II toxin-antitoxin system Phd/YefM family antitoxin [Bosea caraganae]RDJ22313.1 type II toxin-antitoxin system Phd/YefM family antitoxin [Bosea caraganae]RDJ23753.1 type II toxin-antitoxin system Phd/YefM family antitoxin [Bosea caraganae]